MKHRIFIGLLSLLLMFPLSGLAQSAKELGLVLTGENFLHKPEVRDNEVYFHLSVRMKFENRGTAPIIIINPTQSFGTGLREARFFQTDSSVVKTIKPSSTKLDEFGSFVKYFDEAKPPDNMTVILQPGDTFPFEQEIELESALFDKFQTVPIKDYVKWRGKPNKWEHRLLLENYMRRGADFNHFQLTYEFSFLPYVSDSDFLEKLNVRWKKFGRLPIGSSGTYTITSESIKKYS